MHQKFLFRFLFIVLSLGCIAWVLKPAKPHQALSLTNVGEYVPGLSLQPSAEEVLPKTEALSIPLPPKIVQKEEKKANKALQKTHAYTTVLGDTAGYSAGGFSVSDAGAANYSLPITCSPGVGGMDPKISLAYNSQGGNELPGQGFSLQGLSVISRSTKTLAQDSVVKGVDFTGNDTYSLDGERIVPVYGTNGQNGTEYRTEQNAFLRVISYSAVNGSPAYFKAFTKDGLELEFGNTADSRIEAQGSTNILFWLVNKIRDTKGNYFTISYFEDNATGEYRPTQIACTGNDVTGAATFASIIFNYIPRTDIKTRYIVGSQTQCSKLLSSVQCFYQSNLFRSYQLTYQYAPTTGTPLLSQIQEVGMNGERFKPTTFHWVGEQTFSMTAFSGGTTIPSIDLDNPNKVLYNGDFNADGVGDFLVYDFSTGANKWFLNNTNGNTLDLSTTLTNAISTTGFGNAQLIPTDLNGDGYTDILWFDPVTNNHKFFINNKPATFTALTFTQLTNVINTTSFPVNSTQLQLGDFDGNGQTDLLLYVQSSGANRIFLNQTTNGTVSFGTGLNNLFPTSSITGGTSFAVTDLNNDGLAEAFWYDKTTGNNNWWVNQGISNGSPSFGNVITNPITPSLISGGKKIDFGDFNADGLSDLMWFDETNGTTRWFYNKGKPAAGAANFVQEMNAMWTPSLVSGTNIDLSVADINGDGLSDLVRYCKTDGTNRWFINKGKCDFSTNYNALIPAANIANGEGISLGSFRKRGLVDVLYCNKTGGINTWYRSSLTTANVIDTIRNGHGAKVSIDYSPLLEDTVYTKDRTALFPMYDMEAKFYVVSGFTTENATIAGGRNRMKYTYKGAKVHTQGRGFRGFREITATDVTTGIKERKVFDLDHRHISTPLDTSETRLSNGFLISRTINIDSVKQYSTTAPVIKVHHSFVSNSNTKTWDLNGTLVSNQTMRQTMDDYGNPITIVLDKGNGCKDSTFNVYNNYVQNGQWILGRLTSATVTKFAPNTPTITRQSSFTYDLATGLRTQDVLDANLAANLRVTKNYTFDSKGNITQSTETANNGSQMQTRSTTSTYDAQGRFSLSTSNILAQTMTSTYDPTLGAVLTQTDANNRTVSYLYDGFGRKKRVTSPDGNWTAWDYRLCNAATNPANTPANAVFYIYQQSSNAPISITWFDKLDREIRVQQISFDATPVLADKEYDNKGRVLRTSNPYFAGTSAANIQWTYYYYDVLGRDTLQVLPGNRNLKTQYNGLETVSINPLNQSKKAVKDVGGRLLTVYDAQNNTLTYQYDAAGRNKSVTNPQGNAIQFGYDLFGNKTQEIDPDRGTETYVYNQWGQLTQKTDAKGAISRYAYDILGRMTSLQRAEDTVTWIYDTAPNGIGAVASISSTNGHSVSYSYDIYGRTVATNVVIEGTTYTYQYTYNADGRLLTTQYPVTGLRTKNIYNGQGFLWEVRNDVTNALYWQANTYNAKGQLLQETLGNGTVTNYTYHSTNDWLQQVITTKNSTTIQNLSYQFDAIGNVQYRRDNTRNLQEDFVYDNLNRLTQSSIAGVGTVNLTYDILGNILTKSDVGTYNYVTATHRLASVTTNNPNVCIPSFQAQFLYTSFDKVRQITLDSSKLVLSYGYDAQRTAQRLYINDTLRETKLFIGGLYEKKIDKNGAIQHIQYIQGGNGIVATFTQTTAGTSTQYWHKDHLGSVQSISDANGNLVQEFSYDSWGKRRNPNGTALTTPFTSPTDRGFTGHEHLDIFSLINMNGRIYDPVLGRFIQADPFIQDYSNLQNLNRYAYVLNNPLAYTDPTGYNWFSKKWKNIKHFVADNWKPIVAIAVGVLTAGAAMWAMGLASGIFGGVGAMFAGSFGGSLGVLGSVFVSGAAMGFGQSVAGTLLSGGNIGSALQAGIKAGVIGGLTAVATFGVGHGLGLDGAKFGSVGWAEKAGLHGIVQGIATEAQGGKFMHGFISGSVTSAFASEVSGYFDVSASGRVFSAAMVGGTASVLGGGKFASGAVSGMFVQLFNEGARSCDNESIESKKFREQIKNEIGDDGTITSECRTNSDAHFSRGAVDYRTTGKTDADARLMAQSFSKRIPAFCQFEKLLPKGGQTNYLYQNGNFIREDNYRVAKQGVTGSHVHCQKPK